MKKILIAVPCMNQVPAEFADSLARLTSIGAPDCQIGQIFKIGSLIYTSRDDIAKEAIASEADYVMWFDSDMIFPPDTLRRLLVHMENPEVDIVTGLYFRRVQPFTPVLFDRLEINDGVVDWADFTEIPGHLFEVGGCGFGCVLMPTDIFIDVQARFNQMFTPINGVGEDLSFCWRARQLGFKVWCDPTIPLGHVGYNVVTRNFFIAYQQQQQEENNDAFKGEDGAADQNG